jgi:hypothetical protein
VKRVKPINGAEGMWIESKDESAVQIACSGTNKGGKDVGSLSGNELEATDPSMTYSVSGEVEPLISGEVVDTSTEVLDIRSSEAAESGSVKVNLQTSGLAFQVHTQVPTNNQIIDLSARVDLLSVQLQECQSRLHEAMHKIGFLEAQLQQRDQIIDQLCKVKDE